MINEYGTGAVIEIETVFWPVNLVAFRAFVWKGTF